MKNITVTLDDETYRKARIRAAELNTSVSAVVRKYLTQFAEGESRFERLKKQEEAVRARIEKLRLKIASLATSFTTANYDRRCLLLG
jgi:plasmid stability protein